jgi:hypothetical protein
MEKDKSASPTDIVKAADDQIPLDGVMRRRKLLRKNFANRVFEQSSRIPG